MFPMTNVSLVLIHALQQTPGKVKVKFVWQSFLAEPTGLFGGSSKRKIG